MDDKITVTYNNDTVVGRLSPAHENPASKSSSTGFIIGVSFACIIVTLSATIVAIVILRRKFRLRYSSLLKEQFPENISSHQESKKHSPHLRVSPEYPQDTTSSHNLHGYNKSATQGFTDTDFTGPILNQMSNSTHHDSREIDTYMNTVEILNSSEFEKYTSLPEEYTVYCNATVCKVDQDNSRAGFETAMGQVERLRATYENNDASNGAECLSINVEDGIDDISENLDVSMSREQEDEIYVNSKNNNETYAYQQNQQRLYVNHQIQCDSYGQQDILDDIYENNINECEINMNISTDSNIKGTKQDNEKTVGVKTFVLSGFDTNANYSEIDPFDGPEVYENYQCNPHLINSKVRDNAFGYYETTKFEDPCDVNDIMIARTHNYKESVEQDSNDSVYSLAADFSCSNQRSVVEHEAGGGLYSHLREDVHLPVNLYDVAPL